MAIGGSTRPAHHATRTARAVAALATAALLGSPFAATGATPLETGADRFGAQETSPGRFVYQLQGYRHDGLQELERAEADVAVIDLARDAHADYFSRREIAELRASGKRVLAYFEIGSIERFRPEYRVLKRRAADLILNRWDEWPNEFFVKYWTPRWWRLVVRPRVRLALGRGYDGVYLDTPLAYEEIPLRLADGQTRRELARRMVRLIHRIHRLTAAADDDFWVVPQNSPELRRYRGYLSAIDGIGMEELFFRATDRPCDRPWCAENLNDARAIRDADKFVLAVDYASTDRNRALACAAYRREGFAGYVAHVELDTVDAPCPDPSTRTDPSSDPAWRPSR